MESQANGNKPRSPSERLAHNRSSMERRDMVIHSVKPTPNNKKSNISQTGPSKGPLQDPSHHRMTPTGSEYVVKKPKQPKSLPEHQNSIRRQKVQGTGQHSSKQKTNEDIAKILKKIRKFQVLSEIQISKEIKEIKTEIKKF